MSLGTADGILAVVLFPRSFQVSRWSLLSSSVPLDQEIATIGFAKFEASKIRSEALTYYAAIRVLLASIRVLLQRPAQGHAQDPLRLNYIRRERGLELIAGHFAVFIFSIFVVRYLSRYLNGH